MFEESPRLVEMLDRLERADDVERVVGEIERTEILNGELDVLARVARTGVVDGGRIEIDPEGPACAARQERGSVTDAAARVEDVLAVAVRERELVALQMGCDDSRLCLVRDDA